jgi:uncharacterized protein (TIGR02611 family)
MEPDNQTQEHPPPAESRSGFFRKSGVAIIGTSVILIGIPMIPLIGPGWLVVFTGLAILASEFAWAGWLRDRLRNTFLGLIGKQDPAK